MVSNKEDSITESLNTVDFKTTNTIKHQKVNLSLSLINSVNTKKKIPNQEIARNAHPRCNYPASHLLCQHMSCNFRQSLPFSLLLRSRNFNRIHSNDDPIFSACLTHRVSVLMVNNYRLNQHRWEIFWWSLS